MPEDCRLIILLYYCVLLCLAGARHYFFAEKTVKLKSKLMDESAVSRALIRITHEILEKGNGCENLCIVGIKTRGVPLAEKIAANIEKIEGTKVPVGCLDITLYRDDLTELGEQAVVNSTSIPFDVKGKNIVLVDDVLFTGRTARAAIECIFSHGRPACIRFAVLIDRGHRELPIRADFVGKNIPTSLDEVIQVKVAETDGCDAVILCEK